MNIKSDLEIQTALIEATRKAYDIANAKLQRQIPYPSIVFNIRGKCAGRANCLFNVIRYNVELARHNFEAFLERTVKHEVAHVVAVKYYNCKAGHNREWRWIMEDVFGQEASRCHSYDTSNCAARKTYWHIYRCMCGKDLRVGTKYHNQIQANQTILHKTCRTAICREWYKGKIDR
jgi:SprT protein